MKHRGAERNLEYIALGRRFSGSQLRILMTLSIGIQLSQEFATIQSANTSVPKRLIYRLSSWRSYDAVTEC